MLDFKDLCEKTVDLLMHLFVTMPHYLGQLFHYKLFGLPERYEENIEGKVVLITGANSGIGKCVAEEMAMRGARVVIGCRDEKRGKDAVQDIKMKCSDAKIEVIKLELADLSSVRDFAAEVKRKYDKIHILVCNAGVAYLWDKDMRTKDGFEVHMGINHLGHFLLTNLLLDNLKAASPSRIVVVSSTNQLNHKLDFNDIMLEKNLDLRIGFRGYDNSKYCNSLFAKELARRLNGTGVNTYSLCPGLVDTNIFRNIRWYEKIYNVCRLKIVGLTPAQGAETVMYCSLDKNCSKESGLVYRFCRPHRIMINKLKNTDAQRLWDLSEKLVGLNSKR